MTVPARPFSARVRHQEGVAVIELSGEVDARAEDALNAAYEEAVNGDPTAVLLSFDGADYINSFGIGLIVVVLAQARKSRRQVLACGLSDHYREIFQITRLADFMNIFPDEASAIAAASPSALADG